MQQNDDFFQRLNKHHAQLTKKQLMVAAFIKDNYNEAVFLSCVPLAKKAGVSEATIIRFSNTLGYSGFTEMMQDLQKYAQTGINMYDRFESYTSTSKESAAADNIKHRTESVLNSLNSVTEQEQISSLVDDISECSNLILIGSESTISSIHYLNYHFSRIGIDVEIVTGGEPDLFSIYKRINTNTIALSIALPRYTKTQLQLTERLIDKNVKTYTITDSVKSPFMGLKTNPILLHTESDIKFNYQSHIMILLLCQVLIDMYIAKHDNDDFKQELEKLEDYNQDFDVFYKDLF